MQLDTNKKRIVYLVVFLAIPMAALFSFLRARFTSMSNPWLGFLMSTGVVAFVVFLIVAVIYRYLWKLCPKLFGVDNLNGRWEGWYYQGKGNKIGASAHEILQKTPLTVSVKAYGWIDNEMNTSSSTTAAFYQGSGTTSATLAWTYNTHGRARDPGGNHDGTHLMTVVRCGTDLRLHGEYYNNRWHDDNKHRGSWGRIILRHTRRKPLNTIGISSLNEARNTNNWAMPEIPKELSELQTKFKNEGSAQS